MKKFFKRLGFINYGIFLIGTLHCWLSYVFIGYIPYGFLENQDRLNSLLGGCFILGTLFLCLCSDNIDYK